MVFTVRLQRNIAQQDDIIIVPDFFKGALKNLSRVFTITGEELLVCSNRSRRCVGKIFAGMIISRSAKAQAIALAYERAEVFAVGEVYVIGGGRSV